MKITITNSSPVPAVYEHGVHAPSVIMPGDNLELEMTLTMPIILRAPENVAELEQAAQEKAESNALAAAEAAESGKKSAKAAKNAPETGGDSAGGEQNQAENAAE